MTTLQEASVPAQTTALQEVVILKHKQPVIKNVGLMRSIAYSVKGFLDAHGDSDPSIEYYTIKQIPSEEVLKVANAKLEEVDALLSMHI